MIAAGIERRAKDSPLLLSEMGAASTVARPSIRVVRPKQKRKFSLKNRWKDSIVFGLPQPLPCSKQLRKTS